ncbi:hypothetical protein F4818DRAFT_451743 [Hypoxylon cercidicola]|nr:hypothetical protein F4818DRAFT_451743 [Hypoxylon cercidicola]
MSFATSAPRSHPVEMEHPTGALKPLIHRLGYHTYTIYLFSRDNIKDIICTGFLFGTVNASIAQKLSMGSPPSFWQKFASFPKIVLWSWSNLFLFNLRNQRHPRAIAEDALNKPWRPLPAARISPEQTTIVMYMMYPVVLLVALCVGGLVPCLLEALFCLWYNEWCGASDPFLKNLLNGLGFACFLAGPLEVATGHSIFSGGCTAAIWLGILTGCITTTSHTQDFRDKEGDKFIGRDTVPLALGDYYARMIVALGVVGWTSVAGWYWRAGWSEVAMSWVVGGCVTNPHPKESEDTYLLR